MDLKQALSHPSPKVRQLLELAKSWPASPPGPPSTPCQAAYQPKARLPLIEHLGPAGVAELITQYQDGEHATILATRYGYSLTTVKKLLRDSEVHR